MGYKNWLSSSHVYKVFQRGYIFILFYFLFFKNITKSWHTQLLSCPIFLHFCKKYFFFLVKYILFFTDLDDSGIAKLTGSHGIKESFCWDFPNLLIDVLQEILFIHFFKYLHTSNNGKTSTIEITMIGKKESYRANLEIMNMLAIQFEKKDNYIRNGDNW